MATDGTASQQTKLREITMGEVFPCNTGDPHVWGPWEYNTVRSQMSGVEHSFITRTCQECMLIERLELGFVASVDLPETSPGTTTTDGTGGKVIPFNRGQ